MTLNLRLMEGSVGERKTDKNTRREKLKVTIFRNIARGVRSLVLKVALYEDNGTNFIFNSQVV